MALALRRPLQPHAATRALPAPRLQQRIVISTACGPLNQLADNIPDPVLRTAIKEPVAFWGGIFAGALGLNLDEEPLRSWVDRTSGREPTVTKQDSGALQNGSSSS